MNIKFRILLAPIALLVLVLAASGQETMAEQSERELREAYERMDVAVEQFRKARQDGNAGAQDAAEAALRKATSDVDYKKRIRDLVKQQMGAAGESTAPATERPQPSPSPTSSPTNVDTTVTGDSSPAAESTSTSPGTNLDSGANTNPAVNNSGAQNQMIVECPDRPGVYSSRICTIAKNASVLPTPRVMIGTSASQLLTVIYAQMILKGNLVVDDENKKFILDAEELRTDKQVGSDANGKGTTSIVVKGGVPAVFNFATERGAAIRSINGTTVTFRVNPVGLFQTLSNQDYIDGFVNGFKATPITDLQNLSLSEVLEKTLANTKAKPTDSNLFRYESKPINYLRKLGVGFSFDTSRGQESPLFTGRESQLSAFSVRYEFLNERDPRHPKYAEAWRNFFVAEGGALIETMTAAEEQAIFTPLNRGFKNSELQKWFLKLNESIKDIPLDNTLPNSQAMIKRRLAVEEKIREQLDLIPTDALKSDSALVTALDTITTAFVNFNAKKQALLNEIASAPVISLEYTNHRDPVIPDTHNLNFILAKGFSLGGREAPVMDVTFNASLTFFNKTPIGTDIKRIRDFSFAGQLDVPIGFRPDSSFYGTTFSFAGKYQRLTGDITALDGTILPNTRGDIWVGQAKLIIPINVFGIRGIRFPISATFANRTELVREGHIRGNFGFTFDLDKLILGNLFKDVR